MQNLKLRNKQDETQPGTAKDRTSDQKDRSHTYKSKPHIETS